MNTKKHSMLLVLLSVLLLTGCATTVKVEMDGRPAPNYIVRANLPDSGIRIDSAVVHHYAISEGDEYLDTFRYLDPWVNVPHKLDPHTLRSIRLTAHVLNPHKAEYRLWVREVLENSNGDKHLEKRELVYAGNLSKKDFTISLPIGEDVTGHVLFEIRDDSDNLVYQGINTSYSIGKKSEGMQ